MKIKVFDRIKEAYLNIFRSKKGTLTRKMVRCKRPDCHGEIVFRNNSFYSCSEFPDCKVSMNEVEYNSYRKNYYVVRTFFPFHTDFPDSFIALDFETTGLDPKRDHIIEVGAIKYINGVEVDTLSQIINPEVEVCHDILQLTGITEQMLESGKPERDVIKQLRDFIGDTELIVAHNAKFDLLFLGYALKRLSLPSWNGKTICTYKLARLIFPSDKRGRAVRHRLPDVCCYLQIPFNERHRALNDASVTVEVLKKLWPLAMQRGINSILDVSDLVRDFPLHMSFKDELINWYNNYRL